MDSNGERPSIDRMLHGAVRIAAAFGAANDRRTRKEWNPPSVPA